MSELLEQQSKMLGSRTRITEMSEETLDAYFQRYERLRQLAQELGAMAQ
jgi:hypothetical protein